MPGTLSPGGDFWEVLAAATRPIGHSRPSPPSCGLLSLPTRWPETVGASPFSWHAPRVLERWSTFFGAGGSRPRRRWIVVGDLYEWRGGGTRGSLGGEWGGSRKAGTLTSRGRVRHSRDAKCEALPGLSFRLRAALRPPKPARTGRGVSSLSASAARARAPSILPDQGGGGAHGDGRPLSLHASEGVPVVGRRLFASKDSPIRPRDRRDP